MSKPSTETSYKKTFYYKFFPTNPEEEDIFKSPKKRSEHIRATRSLVEVRDVLPPQQINPNDPWTIKRVLTEHEVDNGKIVLSMHEGFEYVLRYWPLDEAKVVAEQGLAIQITMCDITQSKYQKRHVVVLHMNVDTCEFDLICVTVMSDRCLKVNDIVSMFWDKDDFAFKFKLWI